MKTIDFVEAQIRQFVMSKRPPEELRDQIDRKRLRVTVT